MGDYISTSFAGANAVPVFAVGKAKVGGTFDEAMYSVALPVTARQAYPLAVEDDPVLSPQGDRMLRARALVIP